MLIFSVPQHIPSRKQTSETLRESIFTQTILDHFETPLCTSIFRKIFVINIKLYPILEVFPICCFTICKKTKKQFGWEYKKGMHMYCQGPVLNHYDYWPILGQSTRNLIIEGVMFNQDTPWKNIFFNSSKHVVTNKN